ncbi:MAG: GMC oxidoreductase [Spirulina sp.]
MLIDARHLGEADVLAADICIVGAGPAGITIAREFNSSSFKVLLLESGGFTPDPKVDDLSRGSNQGDPYPAPDGMRERGFGGTAKVWPIVLNQGRLGVRYVPLDPIDFEQRDWIPYSGWPINREDLDPYYARAHVVAQSGPYTYDFKDWETEDARAIVFPGHCATTQMFQFGPLDAFTETYRHELEQSQNVSLVTYAHALELRTDELAKSITSIDVGTVERNRFSVNARVVILAQGGLEVPRLLMISNRTKRCGLGNEHDLVGRFLMDHPVIRPGVLVPDNPSIVNQLSLYDARWVNGARVIGKPILTAEIQRKEKLVNINTAIFPRPGWAQINLLRKIFPNGQRVSSPALQSSRVLKQALKQRKWPQDMPRHMAAIVSGLDDMIYRVWRKPGRNRFGSFPLFGYDFDHGGWSDLDYKDKKFGCFDLLHVTEQTPDPNNRVRLSEDCDQFGYRRMVVEWRHSDADRLRIKRAMEIFAQEFKSAGLGIVKVELDHGMPPIWSPSIHHPMGTTRMHDSPTQGVVDRNCQVHGIENLFVASSSAFPTGGYANPTLTILALGIRLADHIKTVI